MFLHTLKKGLRDRLDTMQRKIVRFVDSLDFRAHVGPSEFAVLNWLPFCTKVQFSSLVHLFKVKNGLAPPYMMEDFKSVTDVHCYNLRQGQNFSLAHCKFPVGTFNRFSVSAWNSLPTRLKNITTLQSFKLQLKAHLTSC